MEEKITNLVLLGVLLVLNILFYDLLARASIWVAYTTGGLVFLTTFSVLLSIFLRGELDPLKRKWNAILFSLPVGFMLWLLIG